ncbi:MAG: EGF domain-containing protein [Myxococcaceae bacterium]
MTRSLIVVSLVALCCACGGSSGGGGLGGGPGGGSGGGFNPSCSNLTCDAKATCDSSTGFPRCVCPTGYEDVNHNGSSCTDIDECAATTSPCAQGASCTNTEGSFTCACGPGFTGDGQTCTRSSSWLDISPGQSEFSCSILTGGSLWCLGRADQGRLGTSASSRQYAPARVGTASDWTQVSSGYAHGCALKADHSVYCWGDNQFGEAGIDPATNPAIGPHQVGADNDWEKVSAGVDHTCATKSNHTAWCWGLNSKGQLGAGKPYGTISDVAVQVGTDNTWKVVSAGGLQSCGVKQDGSLWCWGSNTAGQMGIGNNGTTQSNVALRVGTATWNTVSAGADFSCAIKTDGTLWCWGKNGSGQLCAGGNVFGDQYDPVQAGTDNTWADVSAGGDHTCAKKSDGSIWCCGGNAHGQLGNNTTSTSATRDLVRVGTDSDWVSVKAGATHTCGTRPNGAVYCWGDNGDGELGTLGATDSSTPIQLQ